ncbi:MAG: toxin HicA [Candidatus Delongbacteria bacterium]
MREHPGGQRFADLCRVCDHYFGPARQQGGSHRVYRTPWAGDPRVNIQAEHGTAKAYQVRQVLKALDRLAKEAGNES